MEELKTMEQTSRYVELSDIEYTDINWEIVSDYLENTTLDFRQEKEILELIDYEVTFEDVRDYLTYETLSSFERNQILSRINYDCDESKKTDYSLRVETLQDIQKFEIIEHLFYNYSLDELIKMDRKDTL